MTLTQFDPSTGLPVAMRHESETGWGAALLAEFGVEKLEEDVVADLVEAAPDHFAAAGAGALEISTTVDGEVTRVTAWARCTEVGCVAEGAAYDTLNAEPLVDLTLAPDLPAVVAACRAQFASRAMQFTDAVADPPVVWAYHTGVLREVLMYLAHHAFAHAARGEGAAEARLRAVEENARARAADLGLDLRSGPSDLARLDAADEDVWERTARALHDLFADLAPLVEQHPTRAEVGVRT
ncbi:hypothetical protein AB0G86_06230 [Streptomyces scabiei]|uniref:hypothetical protein n=1 Tax=Streptomyces scabiei TaxID=1930 RepID=UPI0033D98464